MVPTPVIRVRRIKDFHSEHPTILDESEEYFNSHDELDVTRLNISKPGELYRVISYGSITGQTTFTREEVDNLLRNSGWVDVIEQEDYGNMIKAWQEELKLSYQYPWWYRRFESWFHKLDTVFPIYDRIGIPDYSKEYHLTFNESDDMNPSYAYQRNSKTPHPPLYEFGQSPYPPPRPPDEPPSDHCASANPSNLSIGTSAIDATSLTRRATPGRNST